MATGTKHVSVALYPKRIMTLLDMSHIGSAARKELAAECQLTSLSGGKYTDMQPVSQHNPKKQKD